MSSPKLHRFRPALLALWCAVLLAACGGAGEMGSGGTGASAEGTVTGFGSIYVDGTRFDDTNAVVSSDDLAGNPQSAETKLGQRVDVGFAVDGVAQTVTVEPEVVGPVGNEAVSGGFKVLGQTVLVNVDPTVGPVTQLDGYASLAEVMPNDLVEVHGVAQTASPGSAIQATRVEKRSGPLPFLRVAGTVAGLLPGALTGPTFTIGTIGVDARSSVVKPAGKALANGQTVVVFARADALSSNGATLTATRIRIRERASGSIPDYLGGVVSNYAGSNTFNVGDVVVRTTTATQFQGGAPQNGRYVQVRGDFNTSGELVANEVKARSNVLDADLRGIAIGYLASTQTFMIRGVLVDASGASFVDCANATWSNQYVEVSGQLGLGGVVASQVKCKNAPTGAVIEFIGMASNSVGKTFLLDTATNGKVSVRWTVLTFFRDNLDVTPLDGLNLRVEGVLTANNVFVATKIRLNH